MALDINQVSRQLQAFGPRLKAEAAEQLAARSRALDLFRSLAPDQLNDRLGRAGKELIFRVPHLRQLPNQRVVIPPAPDNYLVIAADGSAITIDRHSPIPSFVINIGSVQVRYGDRPDCVLDSRATVHATAPELAIVDPSDDISVLPIDDQFVEIEQAIREIERLAELVNEAPTGIPVVALVDGPLVVWGLADTRRQGYIRAGNIVQRYEAALGLLARAASGRSVGFAGFVSFPGTDNVANLIRVARCPHAAQKCVRNCAGRPAGIGRDCDDVATIDRALFFDHLSPGERSAMFGALTEPAPVDFCYVQTGDEVARVEVPGWVAANPACLDLTLAVIVDQVRRGHGYPVALMEADAQAVIGAADRSWFQAQVVELLDGIQLPSAGSAKARSKRVRGV